MYTNNQNWTYQVLDHLPSIPEEFWHCLYSKSYQNNAVLLHDRYNRKVLYPDGKELWNIHYDRWEVDHDLQEWLSQNICREYLNAGVSMAHPNGESRAHAPHTDKSREVGMMWMWDLGGPNVDTVFWQEKGFPLCRPENRQGNNYSDLDEVSRVRIPLHKWHLLNAKVIHSAENIQTPRIGVHVSLKYDQMEFIVGLKSFL
jgi:hypothetical protein